jgi:3-hydroxyacyl-CoA dehydrogenase
VLGAGLMGAGIAEVTVAQAKKEVVLKVRAFVDMSSIAPPLPLSNQCCLFLGGGVVVRMRPRRALRAA